MIHQISDRSTPFDKVSELLPVGVYQITRGRDLVIMGCTLLELGNAELDCPSFLTTSGSVVQRK
jgi:hypothetical protein